MLIKRSITINKHRTSLSLEIEFWEAIKIVSKMKNCSIESIITRIDLNRKTSLASSTRVFLLQFFICVFVFFYILFELTLSCRISHRQPRYLILSQKHHLPSISNIYKSISCWNLWNFPLGLSVYTTPSINLLQYFCSGLPYFMSWTQINLILSSLRYNACAISTAINPSSLIAFSTLWDPGTNQAVTLSAFLRPLTISVKARKSSILPLVQLPIKTKFIKRYEWKKKI
mgnify:CR=1 FL=1